LLIVGAGPFGLAMAARASGSRLRAHRRPRAPL